MKKNNNLGFMLIETLLVSTFVLGVLTYLFLQFSALKRSYDDSFRYDTVPALYGAKNINQYVRKYNGYATLKTNVDSQANGYLEFNCTSFSSGTTCTKLFQELGTNKIYLVKDTVFKNKIAPTLAILSDDDELYRFVKKIAYGTTNSDYHLIVKYADNTYATMSITL